MLKTLMRIQLRQLLTNFSSRSGVKKSKKGVAILYALLLVYAFAAVGIMMGMMFSELYTPLKAADLMWYYFAMAGILSFAISFITSVFTASSLLYQAKDNGLLLSMPIPPWMILTSRVAVLWAGNLLTSLMVFTPAQVVVWMREAPTAATVLRFILGFITLPFLATALACLFGYLVSIASARMRHKNIARLLFSVAFLAVYFAVYFRINEYIQSLIARSGQIASAIQKGAFPAYHFGLAMMGEPASILWWLLCSLLPFALAIWFLSRGFIRLCTQSERAGGKAFQKDKEQRAHTVPQALLGRELRRLASSSNYMLNSSLGAMMAIGLPIFLWVKLDAVHTIASLAAEGEAVGGMAAAIFALAICFSCGMILVSAPSVSLEGKSYWIVRSMPVRSRDVLMAKARAHLLIALPGGWIGSGLACAATRPDPLMALSLFLLPTALNFLIAYAGVAINLRHPRLDWTNEAMVVKQGVSVLLSMLLGFGVNITMILGYVLLFKDADMALYMLVWSLVIACLAYAYRRYLNGSGARRFERLS